jgi:putative flippase GtrA
MRSFFKLSQYAIVGIVFNILGYIMYSAFIYLNLLVSEQLSFIVSSLILFPFVFYANRKFVFHSKNKLRIDLYRYSIIYLAAITYGVVGLTTSLFFFSNPYVAQAVSSIIVLSATFALNNYWSFKQDNCDSTN